MSQDGLQRPSQIAKIAKRNDFENLCFLLFLYCFWNTNPPKRAPRQPRNLRTWFQGDTKSFSKIGSTFCLHLFLKMVPKKGPQSDQKNIQKLVQDKTPKLLKRDQFWAPKWNPKILKRKRFGYRQIWTELFKKLLIPKCPQDGSRWPQIAQHGLLGAFLGLHRTSLGAFLGLHRMSWNAVDPQNP